MESKVRPGTIRPVPRLKCGLLISLLVAILAGAGCYYLLGRQTPPAQAAVPVVQRIADLASGAASGVQGGYQKGRPGDSYQLWKYRLDQRGVYQYDIINKCDSMTDNNAVRYEDPEDRHRVKRWGYDPIFGRYPISWYYCGDRNAANHKDNLAHDWNTTGLDASGLESRSPFLVIGTTPVGGGAIQSPQLQLNLWVPKNTTTTTIRASELCNDDSPWDLNGGTDSETSISITVTGYAQNTKNLLSLPSLSCEDNKLDWLPAFNLTQLDPLARQAFTVIDPISRQPEQASYERYEMLVETSKDRSVGSYTNQFRLRVTQPSSAYLGIGKTNIDPNSTEPSNALGVGMRLPDKNNHPSDIPEYGLLRVQALWEINIYVAVDPSVACSQRGISGRFGLYDTDGWQAWAGGYPPSLEIFQTDRKSFIEGAAAAWNRDIDDNGKFEADEGIDRNGDGTLDSTESTHKFSATHNTWDTTVYDRFRADKVYRFRFYNLDHRSWMQVGIPFGQANALQHCTEKPLFKVYHSDLSIGGLFGIGSQSKACRNMKLTNNNDTDLYANGPDRDSVGSPGSSSEFALYARGEVNSFYSGLERGHSPPDTATVARKLTFANSNSPWGGKWGGALRCMPNYWRRAEELKPTPSDIQLSSGATTFHNKERLFVPPTAGLDKVELSTTILPPADLGLKATIYIDGDLIIRNDIRNDNGALDTFNQINQIYLIVKGDILIDPTVSRIDAVLVAMPSNYDTKPQPSTFAKGRIYTCYVEDNGKGVNLSTEVSIDLHSHHATQKTKTEPELDEENRGYARQCSQHKLTINGALIARQIRLGRTIDPASLDVVREEINLLPEYFISIPLLPAHSDWFYGSDSITILPTNF